VFFLSSLTELVELEESEMKLSLEEIRSRFKSKQPKEKDKKIKKHATVLQEVMSDSHN